MNQDWHVGEFRQSQTGETAYYVCNAVTEHLHKDGTVQRNTGAFMHKYLCDAPGYWRTYTDAQAFLDKWLEENSRPKPKHGDIVKIHPEQRLIVETPDGFLAYCPNGYVFPDETVRYFYQRGDYKVIGNVFEGFCQ